MFNLCIHEIIVDTHSYETNANSIIKQVFDFILRSFTFDYILQMQDYWSLFSQASSLD